MNEYKPNLLQCALMLAQDQCPPEQNMYLCSKEEDPTGDCKLCWTNYLFYVANGRKEDPYEFDWRREQGR